MFRIPNPNQKVGSVWIISSHIEKSDPCGLFGGSVTHLNFDIINFEPVPKVGSVWIILRICTPISHRKVGSVWIIWRIRTSSHIEKSDPYGSFGGSVPHFISKSWVRSLVQNKSLLFQLKSYRFRSKHFYKFFKTS